MSAEVFASLGMFAVAVFRNDKTHCSERHVATLPEDEITSGFKLEDDVLQLLGCSPTFPVEM
jgi:hypothetical protein